MTKLSRQNVGGIDYTMVGCTLTGVCASAASDYVKTVVLSDGDILADGMTAAVTFANGNTAGTAPASLTIYSSDQVNYYSDSGLTQPFTLAPAGCYEIEYTGTGNAYTYTSYPVLQIENVTTPVCDSCGKKTSGAVWDAGDTVLVLYSGGKFMIISGLTNSVTEGSRKAVTSGAVATALKNTLIPNTQLYNVNGYYKFKHKQVYGRTSNFKVVMGPNVIELAMYRADGNMVVSAVQEGKLTAETIFQLGYDNTYLYIKKTTSASPGYSIQAYSLTNAYEPIGTLEVSNQTEFDASTKIIISDYENKATLWENTLVSICNASVLQAGKEVSFTVNVTSIADLPVANRGIVTTRKNILDNRAVQMYFCNESTNNDIYYRYLEWNGSYWSSAIGWKKIQSVAI